MNHKINYHFETYYDKSSFHELQVISIINKLPRLLTNYEYYQQVTPNYDQNLSFINLNASR